MSAPGAIGEVMILGGPASCTARGLVETMCSVFGFAAPSFSVPYPLAYAAAIGIQTGFRALGLDPPVSTRTLEFFRTNNAFDISKSVRLLGYAPRFSLEEGLEAAREGLAGRKQGRNHG
jgi:nucleoside-diphosphate-sugar epimerase